MLALVLASTGSMRAQEIEASSELTLEPTPLEIVEARPDWFVQVEPSLWRPGLFGDLQGPGSTLTTGIEDINLDESTYGGLIEAVIRIDEVQSIRWSAFALEQSERALAHRAFTFGSVAGVAGDAVTSEVRFSSLELVYDRVTWERTLHAKDPRDSVRMRSSWFAGLRGYDFAFDVSANGNSQSEDQQWLDVIVGARLEVELMQQLAFDMQADFGGMALGDWASGTGNVQTGFHWRPNERFGIQFGYRFMFNSITDDDGANAFEWVGSTAGIYLGAIWRF